jgi:Protein of unknown function (DUF1592)/Protein of unknown function (DUF1588)/Protein of unknown function (DUF1595)/Protein of unknown function (DUF1585)/Protein of unknown function (DUF1587)
MQCRKRPWLPPLLAGVGLLLGANTLPWTGNGRRAPLAAAAPVVLSAAPALLNTYCSGCHSSGRARIDLNGPVDRRVLRRDQPMWEGVLSKLRTGTMPPRRFPQPSVGERDHLIHWLEQELVGLKEDRVKRLVVRRLRRTEYRNIVRDLTGIDWQAGKDFPKDDGGWDLALTLPALPAALRAGYQAAADDILSALHVPDLCARLAPATSGATEFPPASPAPGVSGKPLAEGQVEGALGLLAAFARRAFRRRLTVAEVEDLDAAFDRAVQDSGSWEDGIKVALGRVLTSPHFLYRIETRPDPDGEPEKGAITDLELASRLAFFLWSSAPDDELLTLAEHGLLRQDLAAQTRRMLQDPRARPLAAAFADAWLGLARLDGMTEVEAALRRAMRQETEQFFAWILQEDRSVLEFLDADYTFLNERLARHYGIPGIEGEEWRRVAVAGTLRGGLLTQASILTLMAPDGQAGIVQRGKWVLGNVLGTPPPAPPSGLLAAFGQIRRNQGPGTARQLLARHRENPSCAHCHAKIDALGAALEDFDAAGAWRPRPPRGPADDVVLASGEALQGPADLKRYLLKQQPLFIRALSGKLLSYALGHPLQERDGPVLDGIAARTLADPRFSRVVLEVIGSASFQAPLVNP